jgi:hypothetical protein
MPKGERSSGMLLALSQNFRFLLTWRCVDCLRAFGDVYRAKVGYETDVREKSTRNPLISLARPRGIEPLFSP